MNLWGCLERRRTLWKVLEIVHHAQVNINVNRTKQEKKRNPPVCANGVALQARAWMQGGGINNPMPMWDRYGGRAHVKTSVEGEWGGMWRPGTAANAEAAHACVHGGSGRNGGEAAAGKRHLPACCQRRRREGGVAAANVGWGKQWGRSIVRANVRASSCLDVLAEGVIDTGNPWVFFIIPIPVPVHTPTCELATEDTVCEVRICMEVPTRAFSDPLALYKCKDNLIALSGALSLRMTGTVTELAAQTKAYLSANPDLQQDPRFSGFFQQGWYWQVDPISHAV
ncbi:hypothetical protein BC827DRAFT_1158702 [Russula dissimulans]|nr:hypothetical protein BC827DRAFT_1158702 [Russula dissimulans]